MEQFTFYLQLSFETTLPKSLFNFRPCLERTRLICTEQDTNAFNFSSNMNVFIFIYLSFILCLENIFVLIILLDIDYSVYTVYLVIATFR